MSALVVIDTATANLASMVAALRRLDVEAAVSTCPERVRDADWVVLPGVGAFAAGMDRLQRCGLIQPLCERIESGRPTLAVCLGLQLLCAASEESPGLAGLGVLSQTARRFTPARDLCVPQLGWNLVQPQQGCSLLRPGYAYYANSYRLEQIPSGWRGATSCHGGSFVAALQRAGVLACQFHPELSGAWGQALLKRWLKSAKAGASC